MRGNDVKFEYGRPVGSRYGIISLSSYELFVWLCGQWCGGDSASLAPELADQTPLPGSTEGKLSFSPYFSEVSLSDPLVLRPVSVPCGMLAIAAAGISPARATDRRG